MGQKISSVTQLFDTPRTPDELRMANFDKQVIQPTLKRQNKIQQEQPAQLLDLPVIEPTIQLLDLPVIELKPSIPVARRKTNTRLLDLPLIEPTTPDDIILSLLPILFCMGKHIIPPQKKHTQNMREYVNKLSEKCKELLFNDVLERNDISIIGHLQYLGLEPNFHSIEVAVRKNNLEMVKRLLEISPSITNTFAVARAIRKGNLTILEYLLSKGFEIDPGEAGIDDAAAINNFEMVKYLINIGIKLPKSSKSIKHAAKNNNFEMVKYLYETKLKFDLSNVVKPAICCGNLEMVKYLVSIGAPLSCYNDNSLLDIAIKHNRENIIEYLQSIGLQFTENSLYYAIKNNNTNLEKILINSGKTIDPYYFVLAAKHGDPQIENYRKIAKSGNLEPALRCAIKGKHYQTVDYLLGSKVNYTNVSYLLLHAAIYNNLQIIKHFFNEEYLHCCGIELLHYAIINKNIEMQKYLLTYDITYEMVIKYAKIIDGDWAKANNIIRLMLRLVNAKNQLNE